MSKDEKSVSAPSRKVLGFEMKENAFLSSVGGEIKKRVNAQLYRGIEMEMTAQGVLCQYKGKKFLIPAVNCKIIEME